MWSNLRKYLHLDKIQLIPELKLTNHNQVNFSSIGSYDKVFFFSTLTITKSLICVGKLSSKKKVLCCVVFGLVESLVCFSFDDLFLVMDKYILEDTGCSNSSYKSSKHWPIVVQVAYRLPSGNVHRYHAIQHPWITFFHVFEM